MIIDRLIFILDDYKGMQELITHQEQSINGYSTLTNSLVNSLVNSLGIAKQAKG